MANVWKIILSGLVLPIFQFGILPATVGQLLAEDVSDGPCLSISELMPHVNTEVNLRPIMTPGIYYVPMGSKALYRQYAKGLLGRPAATEEELQSMQLVLRCGPLFSTIQNTGFFYLENVPKFSQTCISGGLPNFSNLGIMSGNLNVDYVQAVCVGLPALRPDGSMALHASQSFVSTTDSIIWVNESETVLLTYRCPMGGFKDYKVVSKNKTLSPTDISIIKVKISQLGFSQANVAFMNYDGL